MQLQIKLALILLLVGCACSENAKINSQKLNEAALTDTAGKKHLVNDFEPFDEAGNLNVLVEIPAGSSEKAEVDKKTGQLSVELIDGQPRRINYLAYPFNYGLVPRTLSPLEAGGDGDPLDVILLGEALEKGEFYACRLIGVLQLLDRGEQDDKLVAVLTEGPFAEIYSIAELDTTFIGISSIIEIWFNNYKGVGKMKSAGFAEKNEADRILQIAIGAYQDQME